MVRDNCISVLIVDDEPSFLDLATIYLERENPDFDVCALSSPIEVLEVFRDFDCLVCDYQMPEMDGLEVLEKVRVDFDSDIPFIVFTGKGREEVAMEALNLGADRYLQKGGDPGSQFGVLARSIEQVVEHSRVKKNLRNREKRYRGLFKSAQTGILIVDGRSYRIQESNPYAMDLLGFDGDGLRGMELWSLFHSFEKQKSRFERSSRFLEGKLEDVVLSSCEGDPVYVDFAGTSYFFEGDLVLQCSLVDIRERKMAEEAFSRLAGNIMSYRGEELYNQVVNEVAGYFKADFVSLGLIDRGWVDCLNVYLDGEVKKDFNFRLEGTPCERVAMEGPRIYPNGVKEQFPEDQEIKDMDMEGYAGVPIKDRVGNVVGVLCLMSRERLEMPRYWREALKIIANRVYTELDRETIKN
ncbi:Sensory protein containing REC PAS and GAF domain [Methanonatronarchaeum thermophilum]|uniref:Sensory protein containing REC PAS and GAF domain n=1 Tax=Methanonatronarchaeum thermophilum TaxID=1927129 RepID=A0A1Y3GA67_9EURY|nr:response regulator [Methanonatronarchaeum thermophilum]OUJ18140.1 Sensory protein containing REC PAS and GAF domain [Methanonatronarchaeum thermophilum]